MADERKQRLHAKSITILVLGLLSLMIEEWIGLIIGASGVVLYLIARKEIAQYEIPGEGIAIAGVILSILGTLMQFVNVMD